MFIDWDKTKYQISGDCGCAQEDTCGNNRGIATAQHFAGGYFMWHHSPR